MISIRALWVAAVVTLAFAAGGGSRGFAQSCPSFFFPYEMLTSATATNLAPDPLPASWPQRRIGAVSWTDASGDVWVFGGMSVMTGASSTTVYHNDLLKYTIGTNPASPEWINMTPSPLPAVWPSGRSGAMGWTDSRGDLFMFGGKDANGYPGETWRYRPTQGTWSVALIITGSDVPVGRTGCGVFSFGHSVTLMGGENDSGVLNESLYFTSASSNSYRWTRTTNFTSPAVKRTGAAAWVDLAGKMWVFGGNDGTGLKQDLWVNEDFRLINRSPAGGTAAQPSARRDGFSWRDRNGDLMLYGGYDGTQFLNDAWKYTLNTEPLRPRWIKVSPEGGASGSSDWPQAGAIGAAFVAGDRDGFLLKQETDGAALWRLHLLEEERSLLAIHTTINTPYNLFPDVRNYKRFDSSLTVTTQPANGIAVKADGSTVTFTYRPAPGWTGTDFMVLSLTSTGCAEVTATVSIHVSGELNPCTALMPISGARYHPEGQQPTGSRGVTSWTDDNGDWWIWGGRFAARTESGTLTQIDSNAMWQLTKGTESASPRWIQRTTAFSGPAPAYRSLGWKDNSGDLWLLTDKLLWRYNIASGAWTDMTPAERPAGEWPFNHQGGVAWTDNNGDFWLLEPGYLWRYSIGTAPGNAAWTRYSDPVFSSNALWPMGRYHAMGWTDKQGHFWLFGGQSGSSSFYFSDLLKFDPATTGTAAIWQRHQSSGEWPAARIAGATWTDANGDLWLHGGHSSVYGYLTDLWQFTLGTEADEPRWINRTPAGTSVPWPGERYMHTGFTDTDGNFWLHGGAESFGRTHYTDLWKFEMATTSMNYETTAGTALIIQPYDNIAGLDVDLAVVSLPSNGALAETIAPPPPGETTSTKSNAYIYTPNENWSGNDSFVVKVSNAECGEVTKTINVRVAPAAASRVWDYELY